MVSAQSPRHDTRLDRFVDHYAERTRGMRVSAVRALFAVANRPEIVSLAGGMPNIRDLPLGDIASHMADMISRNGMQVMQYGSGQGEPRIREQICEIMALEGISAHPDDVMISAGSQQGLDLVTRIFCDPGDVVLLESPSYVGAIGTFLSYQVDVVHVPSDDSGLDPAALRETITRLQAEGKRVLFVGDGLNDSAALAATHAGLALASGAGLSREAAAGQLDQVRGERGHRQFALVQRLRDEPELQLLQVAQAAVEHLGGAGGRARREIAGLDQRHLEPAGRRVERRSAADDAAADHDQVELLLAQPAPGVLALAGAELLRPQLSGARLPGRGLACATRLGHFGLPLSCG